MLEGNRKPRLGHVTSRLRLKYDSWAERARTWYGESHNNIVLLFGAALTQGEGVVEKNDHVLHHDNECLRCAMNLLPQKIGYNDT